MTCRTLVWLGCFLYAARTSRSVNGACQARASASHQLRGYSNRRVKVPGRPGSREGHSWVGLEQSEAVQCLGGIGRLAATSASGGAAGTRGAPSRMAVLGGRLGLAKDEAPQVPNPSRPASVSIPLVALPALSPVIGSITPICCAGQSFPVIKATLHLARSSFGEMRADRRVTWDCISSGPAHALALA